MKAVYAAIETPFGVRWLRNPEIDAGDVLVRFNAATPVIIVRVDWSDVANPVEKAVELLKKRTGIAPENARKAIFASSVWGNEVHLSILVDFDLRSPMPASVLSLCKDADVVIHPRGVHRRFGG